MITWVESELLKLQVHWDVLRQTLGILENVCGEPACISHKYEPSATGVNNNTEVVVGDVANNGGRVGGGPVGRGYETLGCDDFRLSTYQDVATGLNH